MRLFVFNVAAALSTAFVCQMALADVVIIGASRDATIYGGNVNNSNGAGPGMFSGTDNSTPTPAKTRSLLAFDIAGNVPAGSTITGVQLTLGLGMVAGGGGSPGPANVTIELHKLLADWGEGTTGNSATTIGGTGSGFAANSGDATWNVRMFGANSWATSGGDFSSAISGSATIGNTLNTTYNWASTAGIIADVQSWLDNPNSNFGWALVNSDETSAKTFRAFYTRESSNASLRPQLQIAFSAVPEPAAFLLAAGGVVSALVVARWRRIGCCATFWL